MCTCYVEALADYMMQQNINTQSVGCSFTSKHINLRGVSMETVKLYQGCKGGNHWNNNQADRIYL